ncbi:MAG: hypothetical protein ACPLKZ_07325, partial [Candidatus Bathyarchaeales archaeon]
MQKGKTSKIRRIAETAIAKHSTIFMHRKWFILTGILVTCLSMSVGRAYAQTTNPLADTGTAISIAWTLAMGALVWFMQLGFAFLGAGYIRQKNQVN